MTDAKQEQPTSGNAAPSSAPVYRGHTVEGGLLASVHAWHDLVPALRLLKTARLLASPVWISIATLVVSLWSMGVHLLIGPLADSTAISTAVLGSPSEIAFAWIGNNGLIDAPEFLRPFFLSANSLGAITIMVAWTLVIWTPLTLALLRVGGQLTAGRDLPRTRPTLMRSLRKTPRAWLASLVPVLASLPFLLLMWLVSSIYLSVFGGPAKSFPIIDLVAGLLIAGLTLPAAVLLGFSKAAIPLSWAAIAIEDDADTLDALSRGYEYCLRRLAYAVCLIAVIVLALSALASGLQWFRSVLLALIPPNSTPRSMKGIITMATNASMIAMSWSLIGGCYLLLRQSAGGQEIDDIPHDTIAGVPPIPSVQRSA